MAKAPTLPGADSRPIDRLMSPFQKFSRIEAAGGILLLVSAAAALIWANSPARESYHNLWHTYVTISIGSFRIEETLAHLVNDGLMAVFFFVVGLEIKRELLVGELASPRKAAIPLAAALGGMVVPATIYTVINLGGDGLSGWAIPAATDIAFALGVMALLGRRVPVTLKIFLAALAIVDDIGAVLVIAFFYTKDISTTALLVAGVVLVLLILANLLHVRRVVVYGILGVVLWAALLKSGVHATIAGVLLAFTIPARFRIDGADFVRFSRTAIDEIVKAGGNENDVMTNPERQNWLHGLEMACEHVQPPMLRLEHMLLPWVAFLIMPVFALANAGIQFGDDVTSLITGRVSLGIIFGLVVGKQVGITLATWLAVKLGLGRLPDGVSWRQIYATSWLAGIGFTMSYFIANLGFDDEKMLDSARLGVMLGSAIAGVVGFFLLRAWTTAPTGDDSRPSSSGAS